MAKRKNFPDAVKYTVKVVGLIQPYVKISSELKKQGERRLSDEYRNCINTIVNNDYPASESGGTDACKIFSLTNRFVIAELGRLNYVLLEREFIERVDFDTLAESLKKFKRGVRLKAGK